MKPGSRLSAAASQHCQLGRRAEQEPSTLERDKGRNMAAPRNRARACRRRERGAVPGSSRGSWRVARRRQSRRGSGESPRLLDLVQIKKRYGTPWDRQEQAEKTVEMHGDVGRPMPGCAGHETPTPAELLVSNSNAGHGEANANARREVATTGATPRMARRKPRPQSTRKAERSPPSWNQRTRIGHHPDRRGHPNERTGRRIRHQNEVRKREETSANAGAAARAGKPCPPPARARAETGADRELERTNRT